MLRKTLSCYSVFLVGEGMFAESEGARMAAGKGPGREVCWRGSETSQTIAWCQNIPDWNSYDLRSDCQESKMFVKHLHPTNHPKGVPRSGDWGT